LQFASSNDWSCVDQAKKGKSEEKLKSQTAHVPSLDLCGGVVSVVAALTSSLVLASERKVMLCLLLLLSECLSFFPISEEDDVKE
jgi:hypothetical protein